MLLLSLEHLSPFLFLLQVLGIWVCHHVCSSGNRTSLGGCWANTLGIQPHWWSASLEHCYLKEHHTVFGIFHSPLLFNVNPICTHSSLVLMAVDDHVTCAQSCSLPWALVNKPFIDTFSFLLKWGPVAQIWIFDSIRHFCRCLKRLHHLTVQVPFSLLNPSQFWQLCFFITENSARQGIWKQHTCKHSTIVG